MDVIPCMLVFAIMISIYNDACMHYIVQWDINKIRIYRPRINAVIYMYIACGTPGRMHAYEDFCAFYHRLKNTWIRNASRDPLNCQLWAADPLK